MASRSPRREKTDPARGKKRAAQPSGTPVGRPDPVPPASVGSLRPAFVPGRDFERRRNIFIGGAVVVLAIIVLLLLRFCPGGPETGSQEKPTLSEERREPPTEEKKPVPAKPKPQPRPVVKKDEPRVIRDEEFKPDPIKAQMALTYTIQKGDSLEKIAANTLGSKARWKEIRDANRLKNIGPRDLLPANRDIMVPVSGN